MCLRVILVKLQLENRVEKSSLSSTAAVTHAPCRSFSIIHCVRTFSSSEASSFQWNNVFVFGQQTMMITSSSSAAAAATLLSSTTIILTSPSIVENDFKLFLQAAINMTSETYFLSALNHPNILKLRAVRQEDMFSPSFFLLFKHLHETLSDRIDGSNVTIWRIASLPCTNHPQ